MIIHPVHTRAHGAIEGQHINRLSIKTISHLSVRLQETREHSHFCSKLLVVRMVPRLDQADLSVCHTSLKKSTFVAAASPPESERGVFTECAPRA